MTNPNAWTTPVVWLASLALLALMGTAAVAQGPPTSTPSPTSGPPTSPTGSPTSSPAQGPPNETRPTEPGPPANETLGPPQNETRGPPADVGPIHERGQVRLENGTADGLYIDFSYDAAAGTLTGYTVGGVEWFAQIQAPSSFEASAQGPRITLRGDGFLLMIMDTPTGLLRIDANGSAIQLDLGDGVEAAANGSRIDLTIGNDSAMVSNATLAEGVLAVADGFFVLRGPSVSAVARAYSPSQAQIEDAVAEGRVAARVQVFPNGTDVLDYQDARVQARQNANGSHRFIVDANFTSGRTFVVEFAPGLLRAESLGVLYYNEVDGILQPAMIQRADSLEDVLLIEAGEGPEYWHVDDLQGEQVLVAIPHFSVHAFDVYAISSAATPMVIIGLVAAGLLVAVLAVGAVTGRRE